MCTWRRTVRKTVNVLENSVTTSGYIKESQKVLPLGLCVGVSIWRKFSGEMEIWEPTEEQRSLHDKKRMYIGHGWLMHLNWGFVFLQNVIEEGSGFGFFFFFLQSTLVLEMEEVRFNCISSYCATLGKKRNLSECQLKRDNDNDTCLSEMSQRVR